MFSGGEIDFAKLEELVSMVGKERLVLDLSCRRGTEDTDTYFVVTDRWQTYTSFAITYVLSVESETIPLYSNIFSFENYAVQ